MLQVQAEVGQSRRKRNMRRRQQDHGLAGLGEGGQGRRQQTQFTDTVLRQQQFD